MQRRLHLFVRLPLFLFLLFFSTYASLFAQTNQDCLGAVEVCQAVFVDDNPPLGTGTIDNEVDGAAACVDSEINSIWFTFTADQDGDIGFLVLPNNPDDDYDWVLFNLTNASCGDIFSDQTLTVSCNAAGGPGCHGPTGTTASGIGNDTPGGCMNDGPLNALVPALAGETYALMVSNWTGTPDGYSLDFSESTIFTSLGVAPTAMGFENTCPSVGNGFIEIQGVGSTEYDYTVTDIDGTVVYECLGCTGLVTTDANLPSGDYTITAVENGTTCPLTAFAAITDNFPVAAAEVTNTPCGGIGVDLSASISNEPSGASVSYEWIGPDGTSYFGQDINAPDDGVYTLIATVDGCEVEPVTINVTFQTFLLLIGGGNTPVCAGDALTLTAFGNGDSYVWNDLNTGAELGTGNPLTFNPDQSTTVQVTATDNASSCMFTSEVMVTVFPGPTITVDVSGSLCEGTPVTLTASGLTNDSYEWSDNTGAPNPRTIFGLSAGTYTYSVSGDNNEGCSSTTDVTFTVEAGPSVSLDVDPASVCDGEDVTVTLVGTGINTIEWNSGFAPDNQNPVTFTISGSTFVEATVTDANGCSNMTSTVIDPEVPPSPTVISCGIATPNSVEFTWSAVPGATSYEITVSGQSPQVVNNTSFTATGLMPGESVTLTVQPLGNGICPPPPTTITCDAQDCQDINLMITPVDQVCLASDTAPFTLDFSADNLSGSTDWSGVGITNSTNGTFDPQVAGIGDHTITLTYSIGACDYSDMITVVVRQQPTANFSASDTDNCAGQEISIFYEGNGSPSATYNWDFAGGSANPGNGQGPHQLSWSSAGVANVSLVVEENGCSSEEFTQTIFITEPIPAPVIDCDAGTSSLTFSWDAIPGAEFYIVDVLEAPGGASFVYDNVNLTYTVANLSPNEFVQIEVTAFDDGPCPNSSAIQGCSTEDCPMVTLSIADVPLICLDSATDPVDLTATISGGVGGGTLLWSGTGINDPDNGIFDPSVAGLGTWTITLTYTEGDCTYEATTDITINNPPSGQFTVDDTICQTGTATVTYTGGAAADADFNWNFGSATADPGTGIGPHTLSWATAGTQTVSLTVTEDGCTGETVTQTVAVEASLTPPQLNCDPTPSSIAFSWPPVPGATGYTVNVIDIPVGATGVYDDATLTYTVTGLNAGESTEIEVVALGDGPCGNSSQTQSCVAEDCPMVMVTIDAVDPICLDAAATAIDLNANISGGAGGGVETWSGTGITDPVTGVFDPAVAGVGTWTINVSYAEGACSYNASTEIVVNAQPSGAFTVDDTICQTGTATLTYTGTATAAADFNWDFGDAIADPGTGIGPHTLSWAAAGSQMISLTVTENACQGEPFSQTIAVDAPLAEPQISCESTTTSITFSWPMVAGATGYTVNVLAIPAGATGVFDEPNLTYSVTNLNAGETVEIEVVALGDGPCGNSSQTQSCLAEDCPMVMVTIDPVDPICLDAAAMAMDLNAIITGGAGSGEELWSGPGITDPTTGVFDPQIAGAGTWTISLAYTEGVCTYNATTEITVNAQPSSEFSLDDTICQTETATATYTGAATAAANFDWDFGVAAANPGTGMGPHTLSWSSAGMQTVSLTVTENDCAGELFTQMIAVEAPLALPQISCATTTSMITFSWPPVPGATGYTVNEISIPAGATGVYDDAALTYTVTGLNPGETVEIEVVAEGDGPCGNSSQTQSCVAEDCATVDVTINPVDPICLNPATAAMDLSATATGGTGGGTEEWAGPGITDPANGTFDPQLAGIGTWMITLVYTEGDCSYNASIEIVVNPQPAADFALDNLTLCVDQPTTLTYTGGASALATYDWDFDGGNAVPGTGQGPQTLSWSNGGTPTVSLTVTENNCASEIFTQQLTVLDSLAVPVIDCVSDNTSLTFNWAAVTGATGYMVNVLNEPAGVSGVYDATALTFSYTNLQPEDEITIEVVALTDSPCGPVSATASCMTQSCVPLAFEEVTFGPYCTDAGLQNLSVAIGDNTGTFTWSGDGVNTADATFDPSTSSPGTIPVSVNYFLNGCSYDTTFQIVVNPVPTASFIIDSPICVDNTANLVFDGDASAAAEFTWDLDGGTISSGTDPGPYTVSWMDAGDYTVTLELTDNGCVAAPFSLPIQVDAVLDQVEIICQDVSATEITFAWNPVPGADTYDVVVLDGPVGMQNGNTYTLTGLIPDQEVTIQVTATGSSVCDPSVTTASCLAQACQPLEMTVTGSPTICSGDDGLIQLDLTTNQAGPFEVIYTLNGTQEQVIIDGDEELTLSNLTETTTFEVISITDVTIAECVYEGGQQWEIVVDQAVEAGTAVATVEFCEGDNQLIDLTSLLNGADPEGVWAESSMPASTGAAFDAANATFNTTDQLPQVYTFSYTVAGGACPGDTAEVSAQIQPTPIADAGADQLLDCTMGTTSIGGSATTMGQSYLWTSNNPDAVIADPSASMTEVSSPGNYTLEVISPAGCSSTDEVVVSADFDVPVANISISDISCFAANDGAIIIDEVIGGVGPFTFSLNGGTPTSNTFFNNLNAGEYSLIIQGNNDCFTELFINLEEPEEVVVELVANIQNGENVINLGETVTLEAVYSPNINVDTIIWNPDSLNIDALNSINVMPQETSTYTVTIIDDNGCSDSDDMTIIVQKNREVYVPTAFSPDDDGVNDILYIGASPEVRSIKSFLIFNRWGESVHEAYDFEPNNPANGWDGTMRGQVMNAAVYVYFAEVEFIDGEVVIFSGDVMLMR